MRRSTVQTAKFLLAGGLLLVAAVACAQPQPPIDAPDTPSVPHTAQPQPTRLPDTPPASQTPLPTQPVGDEGEGQATNAPQMTPSPTSSPPRPTRELPGSVQTAPPDGGGGAMMGEVPESLLSQIVDDLATRLSVGRDAIQVVQAESVVWNDGSLGCPRPGEVYTQALVEGYHVVLQVGSTAYDYRASARGYFFLCQQPFPGLTPGAIGTPSS